jgi:hypothetical protein
VDAMMVIVMDLMIDGREELTHTIKAVHVKLKELLSGLFLISNQLGFGN